MADGAVSFLLQNLEALNGVHNLQRELRSIEALMRDADAKKEHDHQFKVWIQEVRTEAYAIEDVLDLFRLHRDQESVWRHLKMRHSIGNLIQDINTRLVIIKQTKERYQIMVSTSTSAETNAYLNVSSSFDHRQGDNILGIDEPKRKLTTLARSVYEMVKEHFDCHAWIIASKSKTKPETLRSLLEQLGCSTEGSNIVILMHRLQNFLQPKRYVIVVDDLWVKDVWESIRLALPDGNNNRIIITTRRGDIANSCRDDDSIDIHKVQPLSPQWAEQLFYKKAFSRNGRCPSGLEEVSKSILQKCDGLPLGIIEIGRVLRSKPRQTKYEWKKLHDSLESELRSGGALSDIMRVFSASYKDLPYHLKYCFLYMSIFPRIIQGGEEYLNELIGRSLIKEMKWTLMKGSFSVSQVENFCTVCAGPEGNLAEKPRRLSIQTGNFDVSQDLTCVRTFFSFSTGRVNIGSNFKLLKVLDIQSTPLGNFPSAITDLLLLRYLSLRNTNIRSIPKSLRNLRHLETLDLKQTLVKSYPKHVVTFDAVQGFAVPTKIGAMKSLQKLSFVKARRQNRMIQELKNLTKLRKLGIVELAKEDGNSLCHSIEKMPDLLSLDVTSLSKGEPLELDAMTNPPRLLQRLYLKGHLQRFPKWVSSLHDLVRIRLKWSLLSQDNPIEALQDLPNLMELQLLDAYTGTQLDFNSGKSQKLKILDLEQLKHLRFIIMEDGTLPCLQKLIIRQCNELEHVPVGIDGLHHLNELHLCDMPEKFVALLKKRGGELRHLLHRILHILSYQQGQLVEDLS
ncbi:hypothetical protein AAG906_031482 [Vitis piasezkii]